jgi:CheY-like chemotaxis protein
MFAPESGLPNFSQSELTAKALAQEFTQLDVLSGPPTMLKDQPGVACLNAVEDLLQHTHHSSEIVIVYLASHGLAPTSSEHLFRLATGDTRQTNDLVRSLPIDEVIRKMGKTPAQLKWPIIDSCYSGQAGAAVMGPRDVMQPPNAENLCLLASSGPYMPSLAPITQQLTAFGGALIRTLRRGDVTRGRYLSVNDVYKILMDESHQAQNPAPFLYSQNLVGELEFMPNTAIANSVVTLPRSTPSVMVEILYVEDDEKMGAVFAEELGKRGHVVTVVKTPDDARQHLETRFFDIVLVDLFLHGDLPASELITYISTEAPESMLFVASRESKGRQEDSWTILSEVFQYPHRVAAFLFKSNYIDTVTHFARVIRERRTATLSHVVGLDEWVPLVTGRMMRRGSTPTLSTTNLDAQICACVEKLVSRWFAPDKTAKDYLSSFRLDPIESGRSSCAVFTLTPEVRGITPIFVNPLILKIGPREEIRHEVERFDKYVQVGVPLEIRTDKVASAEIGTVGAVIYSLLGETTDRIVEVGQLDEPQIRSCLETVFNPSRKRWYASGGAVRGMRPLQFFEDRHFGARRFAKVAGQLAASLSGADSTIGVLERDFHEHPIMNESHPTTLVHGDLHLGNLLRYGNDRYAMIDYRDVGIGPRLTDFVTLEIACWLLSSAPERPKLDLVRDAAAAMRGMRAGESSQEVEVPMWVRQARSLAVLCRDLAHQNFPDMTNAEYGCLLWLSSVRRSEFRATAVTASEKRSLRAIPVALALAAQDLVEKG